MGQEREPVDGNRTYTMMQACEATGLPYQTLKYYCNEGLVPNVKRDARNRRVFDGYDVAWIRDLACLKRCDMSIQEMHEYLDLCLQGESTIPARRTMLARKRAEIEEQIAQLRESLGYIDWKQGFYAEVLDGKRPYTSNLIGHGNRS